MVSISIRLADPGHLAAIPGLEIAAAAMFPEADLPLEFRHKVTEMRDLRAAVDRGQMWVAVNEQQKTVGFASADVVDGQAYLEELDVLPDFGRQGIGTRLLARVINWARDQQFRYLVLVTFRHLPWNAPFYEKLGFEVLNSSEHGPEIAGLIKEERLAGLNVANRVVMRLKL